MSRSARSKRFVGAVVFNRPVSDSLSPQDVKGWDCLGHVRLLARLQEELGIEFEVDEIMRTGSSVEIKKLLAARQA